jgi:hypothetical protein
MTVQAPQDSAPAIDSAVAAARAGAGDTTPLPGGNAGLSAIYGGAEQASAALQPDLDPEAAAPGPVSDDQPDTTRRPRAIEHSDFYYTRLAVHRYASYATIPLFTAEFIVGRKLFNEGPNASHSLRSLHGTLATGLGALFVVNTVTGVWNLWESRHEPEGRTRRTIHALLMLTADAGFVATASTAPHERDDRLGGTGAPIVRGSPTTHQALAIGSMGLALGSYLMMLIWKN